MAGIESSYLGDDQTFLFILSWRAVAEIGRGELEGRFLTWSRSSHVLFHIQVMYGSTFMDGTVARSSITKRVQAAFLKGKNSLCRLHSKCPMGQALGTPASEGLCLQTDGQAALGYLEYVWGYII